MTINYVGRRKSSHGAGTAALPGGLIYQWFLIESPYVHRWFDGVWRILGELCSQGADGGMWNRRWEKYSLKMIDFSFQRKTGLQHSYAILFLRKKGNTTWRSSWRQTLKMTWLQKTESHTSARDGVGVLWTRCVRWKTSFSPLKDFVKLTKRNDGISKQCWLHPAIEEVAAIKIQVYYWILFAKYFLLQKIQLFRHLISRADKHLILMKVK